MNRLPEKELLRPDEVAVYFSVSRKTIYSWVDTGKIDAIKVNGFIRIPREAIEKIIIPAIQ
jgi:excisionase family DNA binding protein